MIIKKMDVKNFRSIREASIEFDKLIVFLGRNGAGKSSIIYAIDTFYDLSSSITEEDFFDRDTDSPIEIRVTYGDLNDDEKEEFKTYIRDDSLAVKKRIYCENGRIIQKYFASTLQIPKFAEIRIITNKRERMSSWNSLIDSKEFSELNKKVSRADDIENLMVEYETNHPELTEPFDKEEQFIGPKNIGGGKLDNYTKFVLVPAVREASDETSDKKGAIYQILDMIVVRKINSREDVKKLKSEFEEKIEKTYSSENLTELPELGNSISNTLEKFAPGSKLKLGWDKVKLPVIQLPSAKATLIEDHFEGDITHKGHGLQRALIVTLLQHLALTVPLEPTSDDSITEINKDLESLQGPDLILAIEEPELYLHPSRCRYLSNLLIDLAEKPSVGLGARNQIIYTSHSPYFVDLDRFDQIRMVKKVPSTDSIAYQSVVSHYTIESITQELRKICNSDTIKFTRESTKARAMSVMNTIVNEGFFGDVVVVVEGTSDLGTLWKLQEIMEKNWSSLEISIVPAGGKNNIDRPVIIFRGLKINTYFIFDADSHHKGDKKEQETKNRNHRYCSLANVPKKDFPETQVHDNWAVFNKNLEGLYEDSLGLKVFNEIKEEVASELGYDDKDRVIKNIEGTAYLIEKVYEKGYKIPILEEIIEKITKLSLRS